MLTVKRSATCSTRGGSQGTYITFASAMRIRQPALALKTRGDITRNPKQGYQWPQNRTCVCVRQKYFKKKKKKKKKKKIILRIQNLYPELCIPFYVVKDQQEKVIVSIYDLTALTVAWSVMVDTCFADWGMPLIDFKVRGTSLMRTWWRCIWCTFHVI